jgi:hypothetical protein
MMREKLYLFVFLLFEIGIPLKAQSYTSQQINLAERIESIAINAPPELAYIQTSKDIFETGEDLWFKVYLLDAQSLIPSLHSNTLYLQLLEETSKNPVWKEKYEIQNGFSNGRVYLSTELKEGNYLLTAYTPNSFFSDTTEFKAIRRIKVVTDITTQKAETAKPEDPSTLTLVSEKEKSVQFNMFPEGGDLVAGIKSKLAFKAVNKRGEPDEVKGTLFENNIPLLEFCSTHAGMGSFSFTPDKNKKYFIRLTQPSMDTIFLLPGILPGGMSMSLIARDKESLSFKITQSKGFNESDFYVRVQCRGVVYGMTTGKINDELLLKIPLSLLPQGIAEVTLFNSSLVPVAERLVYINQDWKLNITAELSEKFYPLRGKVVIKVKVKDEMGQPVMANLGITVFEKVYQNQRDSSNILSHVYLSSQLKGRIYNPSFYFNSKGKGREEALDLLMLTQGWRRYTWSENNLLKKLKTQQIIFDGIEGLVMNRKKKAEQEQFIVAVFSPNIDSTKIYVPTDSNGRFSIPPEYFKKWQGENIYMRPISSSKQNILIKLSDAFETINSMSRNNEFIYASPSLIEEKTEISDTKIALNGVVRIKEVTIKGKKSKAVRDKYLSNLDITGRYKEYVCRYNILNCWNHPNEIDNRKPVDGERYSVESGGVYLSEIYHANNQPELTEKQLLKLYNLSRTKAYFNSREFYNPDYDKEKAENNLPDFRNTLLWQPAVFTDINGEVTLSFFCSDINSSYVGRIEGVGGDGLLGSAYFNFNVRKVMFTP